MQRCAGFLFLSLILCAALSETLGLAFSTKEKRGWTLNSAGYLLGPHAVDNHRSFNDKHGFTGKREIQPDEDIKAGTAAPPQLQVNSTKLTWMGPENYITASVMNLILDALLSSKVFFEAGVYYRVPIQRRFEYKKWIADLGGPLADENIVRTVIEFLTYLHLKEVGALDKLPSPEETNQS